MITFASVVKLLETLEHGNKTKAKRKNYVHAWANITSWVKHHENSLREDPRVIVAFLSILDPSLRTDRKYGFSEDSLAQYLVRVLGYGSTRAASLKRWKQSSGDLGLYVQRLASRAEHQTSSNGLCIVALDDLLEKLASRSRFSARRIHARGKSDSSKNLLRQILVPLSSVEIKWALRLVANLPIPIAIPSSKLIDLVQPGLSNVFALQNDLHTAVDVAFHAGSPHEAECKINYPIAVVSCAKARGIEDAWRLVDYADCFAEVKYDGERMQIHIDRSKGHPITIYSKSGRDSTLDRKNILGAILEATQTAKFRNCILEGELVVYCDAEKKIQQFSRLRYHVSRAGLPLGRDPLQSPAPNAHLCAVIFDVLMMDEELLMERNYSFRRHLLSQTLRPIIGRCMLAESYPVLSNHLQTLQKAYNGVISSNGEGIILKNSDAGPRRWAKLKQDYINGCGDTADFLCIGASFDPKREKGQLSGRRVLNTFFIGAIQQGSIRVLFTVSYGFELADLLHFHFAFQTMDPAKMDSYHGYHLEFTEGLSQMEVLFDTPAVFELLGAGFDVAPRTNYYVLRFPRFVKCQSDRGWLDCVSFRDLQHLAVRSNAAGLESRPALEYGRQVTRNRVTSTAETQSGSTEPGPSTRSSPSRCCQDTSSVCHILQHPSHVYLSYNTLQSHIELVQRLLGKLGMTGSVLLEESLACLTDQSIILIDSQQRRLTRHLLSRLIGTNTKCRMYDWRILVAAKSYAVDLNFVL